MYTLKELCEKWGKTENDIFRMAANEEIVLSFWWNGGHVMEIIDLDPPITPPTKFCAQSPVLSPCL
jgi:hypothetical protein